MKRKWRVPELKATGGAPPAGGGEWGFTMVELVIALALSVIIVGGMVGLMAMSFRMFSSSRTQQALNDSSRKALSIMVGELRCTLGLNSTDLHEISFYGDINDEYPSADRNDPKAAPKVDLYLVDDQIWQRTTSPDGLTVEETVVASNVGDLNFYYYTYGVVPDLENLADNSIQPPTDAISKKASLVVIELVMTKDGITRTYRQDVIFRSLKV